MRQAQTLKDTEIKRVLAYCATRQHSARDTTIVVFSEICPKVGDGSDQAAA